MPEVSARIEDMNDRTREVFRRVVESFLETGSPVGSRSLTRQLSESVSAATIRNVMADLEYLGLIGSPHVSSGRVPTQAGLRLFVDGLLEVGDVGGEERELLDQTLGANGDLSALLDRVGSTLSGLARGASLVLTPKHEAALRHVEFVSLSPDRALVVLVFADGHVENRLFIPPPGQTASSMREAANFVSAMAQGRRLSELRAVIAREIGQHRQEIDRLARALVEEGLASWAGESSGGPDRLIVRGRGNLLGDPDNEEDLERIRALFDDLEKKNDIASFLEGAEAGDGVRIFIGSENKLFSLSGSSLVVSPYMNADRKIIGAVGIIGPTRLNYGRIVPMVDYTAQLVGRLIADRS